MARKPESVTIRVFNSREDVYQVLNVIEFTSARKRMSVIVRTPKGEIKIYVKVGITVTPHSLVSSGHLCCNLLKEQRARRILAISNPSWMVVNVIDQRNLLDLVNQ